MKKKGRRKRRRATPMAQKQAKDAAIEAGEMQLGMVTELLQRMVMLQLSNWLHTSLLILRDVFGFTEEQITLYSQKFREMMDEQETA